MITSERAGRAQLFSPTPWWSLAPWIAREIFLGAGCVGCRSRGFLEVHRERGRFIFPAAGRWSGERQLGKSTSYLVPLAPEIRLGACSDPRSRTLLAANMPTPIPFEVLTERKIRKLMNVDFRNLEVDQKLDLVKLSIDWSKHLARSKTEDWGAAFREDDPGDGVGGKPESWRKR